MADAPRDDEGERAPATATATTAAATPPLHRNAQRVQDVLASYEVTGEVVTLADSARTAADAAAALGCEQGAIVKSLVFVADGSPILVLTSGSHQVDLPKVAGLLGVQEVARADADTVRRVTGFPIGGVAPVGHPEPIGTLVDIGLQRYDVIWAAAGTPHNVFPTTYDELLRITAGEPAEVA
jgi:prolyl-tRNA editing enzyme YbaK/EbsC (Cys-tRNA(Pro) deacylase)